MPLEDNCDIQKKKISEETKASRTSNVVLVYLNLKKMYKNK